MTDSETDLWIYLRKGINGFRFRRQHPIGLYIADFFCHKAKLIIEIDGSIHNLAEVKIQDKNKEDNLIILGYHIIRFLNKDIHEEINQVLYKIRDTIINIINLQKQNASPIGGV